MVSSEGILHFMEVLSLGMPEGRNEVDLIVNLPMDEYNELKDEYSRETA
jgi:hypothetical protein